MNEEKLKALNSTVAMIEKQYGKGAIMKLGDATVNTDLEVIPTGCLSLDLALGVGGVPRGRIMEIYGPDFPQALVAWENATMPSAEAGRRCRVYRRRTRARRCVCQKPRREH